MNGQALEACYCFLLFFYMANTRSDQNKLADTRTHTQQNNNNNTDNHTHTHRWQSARTFQTNPLPIARPPALFNPLSAAKNLHLMCLSLRFVLREFYDESPGIANYYYYYCNACFVFFRNWHKKLITLFFDVCARKRDNNALRNP